jgi:Domain of unknown function (DUF4314)
MDTHTHLPAGTEGIVRLIDDIGTIFADWDNGSTLGLIPQVDEWEIIERRTA